MTIKRIVDTKFWRDEKVIDTYSVEDKYFLLYLMTNPNSTQLGIYKAPKRVISFETGYTVESVEVLIDRFTNKYKNILYNHATQEISVVNSLKYSIVKGGKPVSDLLTKELNMVDCDELVLLTYEHMQKWWLKSKREFDKTVMSLFEAELQKRKVTKEKSNDNDNDNENEESYHESYNESLTPVIEDNFSIYGEFKNVKLTQAEYDKLIERHGETTTLSMIENLSGYMKQHGKRYKSHYATILNWIRRDEDNKKPSTEIETPSYMNPKKEGKRKFEKVD